MGGLFPFFKGPIDSAQRDEPHTHNPLGYNAAIPPGPPSRITRLTRAVVHHLSPGNLHDNAKRSSLSIKRASTNLSTRLSVGFRKPDESRRPVAVERDSQQLISSVLPEALRPGKRQQPRRFPAPRPSSFPHPPPVPKDQPPTMPTLIKRLSGQCLVGRAKRGTDDATSERDSQQAPISDSPPIPRLSPVAKGIALIERANWLRDNPERTTALDSAVQSIGSVEDKPTSVELIAPGVKVSVVNSSHTFETILGHEQQPPASLGPMHTLGLKPTGVAVVDGTGSRPRRRPLPAHNQGKQPLAVTPAPPVSNNSALVPGVVSSIQNNNGQSMAPSEPLGRNGKRIQVPAVDALGGLPSVIRNRNAQVASGLMSAHALDANNADLTASIQHGLSSGHEGAFQLSMRNELHFEYVSRPRSFRLPLESAGRQPGQHDEFGGLAPAESKQLKRLSDGFLHAGPDLNEAAMQIFEQVRQNPPRVDSVRAKVYAIERGREDPKVRPPSPPNADLSLFDSDSFPFLDVAARALAAGKETLRGPLPPGYTSHNGGPPTVDRSAFGDFGWQRFSDQEYVDPAVEDFVQNRRKRLNKRKQDLAAWDAAAATQDGASGSKSTPAPALDAAGHVNVLDTQAMCEGGNAEGNTPPLVPSKHSDLLDMIDFTDSSSLSPRRRSDSSLPEDLIQF